MNTEIDNICLLTIKTSYESREINFVGHSIFNLMKTEEEALPLLWCSSGSFCLIPKEVIMNAVNSSKIFRQTDNKVTPPVVFLTWDQGIPLSNQAGRALVGE